MAILPLQLARVSNLLRSNVATSTIAQQEQSLLEVQNQLSTGKKINSPSDDPGDAAIVQQLQKTLEQRKGYSDNLQQANNQLSEVDSTMNDLTDLLTQAQQIASANVGSDVTADQRASAAAVVKSLYSQALTIGNKEFEGSYIFGGDRSTAAPFVENSGGVEFVGSSTTLENQYDENTVLPFMVDGNAVFGALSTRVQGTADLTPALSATTRLSDLKGATGDGVRLGSIAISNGSVTTNVDLSNCDTVQDVINAINAAGVGGITASVGADNVSLQLSGGAGDNITVNEVGGGTTASDLGLLTPTAGGAGNPVNGASVRPTITPLTNLADLKAGAGIDLASGIKITNGSMSKTIDFSDCTTVEDMLNKLNNSGLSIRAEINDAGNGINILNPNEGAQMTIAENGGTTAADLGVRSFSASTPVSELNNGKGVRTVDGDDMTFTDSNGVSFNVDLNNPGTVQDVIDAINSAATTAGAGVTASFATSGNGIVLTDTAGGAGKLTAAAANFSNALTDLGLTAPQSGGVITGSDVDPVTPQGIFANLQKLETALESNDQDGITAAAQGLQTDHDRVVQIHGQVGAQVQEFQSRQDSLDNQNLATQALLSSLQDTDFTEAISKFQTLQTSLQATLQSSAQILNMSLLDFLS
jgi:flagellar hook-associated protein 3